MIEELLTSYVFEKLDKQIVKKIPYSMLIALLIYYFYDRVEIILFFSPILFVTFLISSVYFNYKIAKTSNNMWAKLEFKELLGRMTDIYEKGDSWLKDMKLSKQKALKISGFLSGFALTLTLSLVFLLLLDNLPLGNKQLVIPFSIVVALFLLYDVAKSNLIEEPKEENSFTPIYDVMDTYLVENSMETLPANDTLLKVLLTLTTRIISPLIYFSFPKFSYKELFVYNNPKLRDFIKQLNHGHRNITLKQQDGYSLENFFVSGDCDWITELTEKTPAEVFPYLLSPDYKFSDRVNKKWIALTIIKKQTKETEAVGNMFIHMFRGSQIVTKHGHKGTDHKVKPSKEILLFMLLGERSTIQYIETKINTMTVKVPLDRILRTSE